jgi:hypothetical protein
VARHGRHLRVCESVNPGHGPTLPA